MAVAYRKASGMGRSTVVWGVRGSGRRLEYEGVLLGHTVDVQGEVHHVGSVQGWVCHSEVDWSHSLCHGASEGDRTCGSDHPHRPCEGRILRFGHAGPTAHHTEARCCQNVGGGQSYEHLVPCSPDRSGRADGHNLCMACLPGRGAAGGCSWAA